MRVRSLVRGAAALLVATTAVHAEDAEVEAVYVPLLPHSAGPDTRWAGDYSGAVQLGGAYTSDDNFMFGQYNGLHEEGATLIGNLRWRDFSGDSYWTASVDDLGLDTREGAVSWGRPGKLRLELAFGSQLQVRNDSGATPFRGNSALTLPGDWVGGPTTSDWVGLDDALKRFDRELQRDKLSAAVSAALNEHWRIEAGAAYEEKQGTGDRAGAFYTDASEGDAALLPLDIDYSTTELDLGLLYNGDALHLEGRLDYSGFDNGSDSLRWQDPYTGSTEGALSLAPDNEQWRGRLTGQWVLAPTARFQFDGSYAVASQDQSFLDYTTVPPLAIVAIESPPRNDLDGEVAIGTIDSKLLLRPLDKLNLEAFLRVRDRDYDVPRDGYRYVRGDSAIQPDPALTVYNTAHDYLSRSMGAEASYRLPLRSRLSFEYAYESIKRKNSAVTKTEEDRYTLGYRIQPWRQFSARLELRYAERSASRYNWDQRYYALLDTELINATPDNQRFINHPEFSQYYLSNREQWQGKADFTWLPADAWSLNLNLLWRDDDYGASELGVTGSEWGRLHAGATWAPSAELAVTFYAGLDSFESNQTGRAFRGGPEKSAFEIYPPLPQASDPTRNWDLDATDTSVTVGASLQWQAAPDIALEADFNYVDTEGKQDLADAGAADLDPQDYPSVDTELYHLTAAANWQWSPHLSLRLDYQYYDYNSNDWSWQGVAADTIDTVLTFGAQNPDEEIHYLGLSAIYRWQ